MPRNRLSTGPLIAAATLIGIGMGGFIDGILLHQILQWHQMLSAKVPPDTVLHKEINMFWDGIFHAFTWLTTAAGIGLLWRLVHQKTVVLSHRLFVGGLVLGWGLFNIVEGTADHYLLNLHNVREASPDPMLWNHLFTAFSVVLLLLGWLLIRQGRKHAYYVERVKTEYSPYTSITKNMF